jgi:hypothetical protein
MFLVQIGIITRVTLLGRRRMAPSAGHADAACHFVTFRVRPQQTFDGVEFFMQTVKRM